VPGAVALGREIAFVMRIGRQDMRHALGDLDPRGFHAGGASAATLSGLLVSNRTRRWPSSDSILAAVAKLRASTAKPSRVLASTVSKPWSCSA
jgi:hypothetical protein